jgi:hypothetical protein
MSAYRYIQAPPTSSVRGATGVGLIQLPSQGSYSGVTMPAAAAIPVAAAGGGGGLLSTAGAIGTNFLANFLAELAAGQARAAGAGSMPTDEPTRGGGKFMITTEDVRSIYSYADKENFNRQKLNAIVGREVFPLIDPDQIIAERESELRRSAAEAGAREYALEQVKQQGNVQSALAGTIGTGLTSAGNVAQQSIASALGRPNIDPMDAELARAF